MRGGLESDDESQDVVGGEVRAARRQPSTVDLDNEYNRDEQDRELDVIHEDPKYAEAIFEETREALDVEGNALERVQKVQRFCAPLDSKTIQDELPEHLISLPREKPLAGHNLDADLTDVSQVLKEVVKCKGDSFYLLVRKAFLSKKFADGVRDRVRDIKRSTKERLHDGQVMQTVLAGIAAQMEGGKKELAKLSAKDRQACVKRVRDSKRRGERMRLVSEAFEGDGIFLCFAVAKMSLYQLEDGFVKYQMKVLQRMAKDLVSVRALAKVYTPFVEPFVTKGFLNDTEILSLVQNSKPKRDETGDDEASEDGAGDNDHHPGSQTGRYGTKKLPGLSQARKHNGSNEGEDREQDEDEAQDGELDNEVNEELNGNLDDEDGESVDGGGHGSNGAHDRKRTAGKRPARWAFVDSEEDEEDREDHQRKRSKKSTAQDANGRFEGNVSPRTTPPPRLIKDQNSVRKDKKEVAHKSRKPSVPIKLETNSVDLTQDSDTDTDSDDEDDEKEDEDGMKAGGPVRQDEAGPTKSPGTDEGRGNKTPKDQAYSHGRHRGGKETREDRTPSEGRNGDGQTTTKGQPSSQRDDGDEEASVQKTQADDGNVNQSPRSENNDNMEDSD
ncbi:MAG: hypothetical protein M1823_002442 [Watsoniomyces obsoletus]|nr:MAG: hypothetical protein M1823_002442 [Watsoniomyces obsoletus]